MVLKNRELNSLRAVCMGPTPGDEDSIDTKYFNNRYLREGNRTEISPTGASHVWGHATNESGEGPLPTSFQHSGPERDSRASLRILAQGGPTFKAAGPVFTRHAFTCFSGFPKGGGNCVVFSARRIFNVL